MNAAVAGRLGRVGLSALLLVGVGAGTGIGRFGTTTDQNVRVLKHVPPMIWGMIGITLVIEFVTMDHTEMVDVVVQRGGVEDAATTVCIVCYRSVSRLPLFIHYYSITT
jgi:hypothetical protein